jgi:hypothetical protein
MVNHLLRRRHYVTAQDGGVPSAGDHVPPAVPDAAHSGTMPKRSPDVDALMGVFANP